MEQRTDRKIDVEITAEGRHGKVLLFRDGHRIGEMTWAREDAETLAFDHTWISPSARGESLGRILIEHGAAYAREHSFKVNPTCPYVAHVFDATDEYDDLDAR